MEALEVGGLHVAQYEAAGPSARLLYLAYWDNAIPQAVRGRCLSGPAKLSPHARYDVCFQLHHTLSWKSGKASFTGRFEASWSLA